jgi:hypothetical protein
MKRYPAPPGWPCDIIHLSIKTKTKRADHDWRDFQRIKNELVGPEHEAVELYPAESRLVDTSNQFHLWVMADPSFKYPFGWHQRFVSEGNPMGTKQRPFRNDERPDDCVNMTAEKMQEMIENNKENNDAEHSMQQCGEHPGEAEDSLSGGVGTDEDN